MTASERDPSGTTGQDRHPRRRLGGPLALACVLVVSALASSIPTRALDGGAPRATAVIAALDGDVQVLRGEAVRGYVGQRLQSGDEVRVGTTGSATIYFSGGHVVRVPAGNRLEIVQDPGPAPPGRAVRMSARTVEAVETGLWIVSDPAGRLLLTGMRGHDDAGPDAVFLALSPRRETVLDSRPLFHWHGDGSVRVVLFRGDARIWESAPSSFSPVRYPDTAPGLEPGAAYAWGIVDPAGDEVLTEPVPFRVASRDLEQEMALLEQDLAALEAEQGKALAGFLRCSYLVGVEAWSAAIAGARELRHDEATRDVARQVVAIAARGMGLHGRTGEMVEERMLSTESRR